MLILEKILAILQILSAVIVMILVLLQADKDEGNIVTGSSESSGSGMGMSRDKKLARLTAWAGTAFVVLTIATSTIMLLNLK